MIRNFINNFVAIFTGRNTPEIASRSGQSIDDQRFFTIPVVNIEVCGYFFYSNIPAKNHDIKLKLLNSIFTQNFRLPEEKQIILMILFFVFYTTKDFGGMKKW